MKNLEPNSVKFEIRNYPKDTNEQLIAVLVIFLYGFGLLFFFIEVDDKIISINSVLLGSSILIIGYLYKFFFKRPKLDGEILIDSDLVIFNRTEIPIENIDYISINYKDFRGRIIPKRREIPLPRFGTNNEFKIKTKDGRLLESMFFVKRKKDRKQVDKFVQLWIDKKISVDYLIDDEFIATNNYK